MNLPSAVFVCDISVDFHLESIFVLHVRIMYVQIVRVVKLKQWMKFLASLRLLKYVTHVSEFFPDRSLSNKIE